MSEETCIEIKAGETTDVAPFLYQHIGVGMSHNYLCAVCRETKAVLECWHGILQPCWSCQGRGYKLIRFNRVTKYLYNLFASWENQV